MANIEVEAAEIAQPETGTAGIGAVVRDNRARWARWETLNKDNLAERRELSYQYSLAKYAEYERRGQTRELMAVLREASTLFGDDAAWNRDVIRKAASEHKALKLTLASEFIPSGKKMGRPTHYPTEGMDEVRKLVKLMRLNKLWIVVKTGLCQQRTLLASEFIPNRGHENTLR